MTTTTGLVVPSDVGPAEPNRDRWGRPLIVPVGGGKPVAYQRPSSYGKKLEDTFNLERWRMRNTLRGLAQRPDLLTSIQANESDTNVDKVAKTALDAAAADKAATYGTSVHALTERIDAGEDIPAGLDEPTKRTLRAYRKAMDTVEVVEVERFVVCDEGPGFAGTLDRILRTDYGLVVGDVKTGNTNKRTGHLAYVHAVAIQMAIYARSVFYDVDTGVRLPTPDINPDVGVVIHLPAGAGAAQLHWIDLAAGWQAVQLAEQVHAWRKRTDLAKPTPMTPEWVHG